MPAKIIIIHGLNNKPDAFLPLKTALESQGFDCQLLCLPGHGKNREEAKTIESAMQVFDQNMTELTKSPYSVLAFSQGALYLQLWMEKTNAPLPQAQVLLAPALYIRNFTLLNKVFNKLPSFAFILSQMPKKFRRYAYLYIWEYKTLFDKAKLFSKSKIEFKIPTQIFIDPKDELVDAKKIIHEYSQKTSVNFRIWERPYLKGKRPGKYHILFDPKYFEHNEWDQMIQLMTNFFHTADQK